jgi:hypothetical protein
MADLTGKFIANTYQNLVQKPDISREEYNNGLGTSIYINGDPIGTIKMFSPFPYGTPLSTYFDNSTGLGITGSSWYGWALADSRNGTVDLRGRFVVGYDSTDSDYSTIGATSSTNKTTTLGKSNIPLHKHVYGVGTIETGSPYNSFPDATGTSYGMVQRHRQQNGPINVGSDGGLDFDTYSYIFDSEDGHTDGLANGASTTPTPIEKRPPYFTVVFLQKVI